MYRSLQDSPILGRHSTLLCPSSHCCTGYPAHSTSQILFLFQIQCGHGSISHNNQNKQGSPGIRGIQSKPPISAARYSCRAASLKPFYSLNQVSWSVKEDNSYTLSRTSVPPGSPSTSVSLSAGWEEGQRM